MTSSSETRHGNSDSIGSDETAIRILDMALESFLEFGYRRTTIDTVAKRLGVSRVTLYRYHSDKASLFQAVILREVQRSAQEILAALSKLSVEQNPVVEGFVMTVNMSRKHPLFLRLMSTEPEWLVLHLTSQGEKLIKWAGFSAEAFMRQSKFMDWLKEDELDVAAELLIRMLVSAVITPGGLLGDDGDGLRRAALYLLKPLLRSPVPDSVSSNPS
ncbi:MAG: hypothetical protein CMK89_08715 [Pseudomonadales bacterium]|nr:hypothetical protein [Pseudomonadales bacterium]